MSPAIKLAVEVEMTEPVPTAKITVVTPTAIQPLAGNMTEHIYGKIALTTGAIQTAIRPTQEFRPNLQLQPQLSKFQFTQKISKPPMALQ